MKKLFALLLAAVMMFAGAGGHCFAAAETTVSIWLDGEKIVFPDAQPILADARVLVPVRGFFEKIGVTVDWNPKSRMVIIKDDAREIMMEAGNRAVLNNGAVEYLDCSVLIKDNRAYIPIRYISENFGCKVQWDGKTRSVYVTRTSADASGDPDEASELPTVGDLESLYQLLKYNGYMADYLGFYNTSPGAWTGSKTPDIAAPEASVDYAADAPRPSKDQDHSGTNVQVEGVDEGDIIKTDGRYIYIAGDRQLTIINADPQDLRIVSAIPSKASISEVYIHKDRLVIICGYSRSTYKARDSREQFLLDELYMDKVIYSTNVKVYDISDRAKPVLLSDKDYEGIYVSSRMIDDDLYIVTNSPVKQLWYYFPENLAEMLAANDKKRFIDIFRQHPEEAEEALRLTGYRDSAEFFDGLRSLTESFVSPRTVDNITGETTEISLKDVYYFRDMVRPYYMMTIGLDLAGGREDVKVYLGHSGSMYASREHLYAAVSAYEYNVLKSRIRGYPVYDYLTTIYRFGLEDGRISYEAKGKVPGEILNQFSMDEYDGVFRIATTARGSGTTGNNVYTLDKDMNIIGRLEGIAEDERIYSTRFAGERIYMVTFRQTDPFFVIDASDPGKPAVLGYLKIPGFSTYLHILDKDHVLGFGYETEEISEWSFDTTGFKISLFDVSDVSNPVEAKKEVIGEEAYSLLADDHKALMISPDKGIMGFPVIYINSDSDFFAGYYLYDLSPGSFSYRGRVTHVPDGMPIEGVREEHVILRGFYIGNDLYTLSGSKLQVNDLATLVKKGSLSLEQ